MRAIWLLAPLLVGCMTTADFARDCAARGYPEGSQAFYACVQQAQADYNCAIANVASMGSVDRPQQVLVTDANGNTSAVQVQQIGSHEGGGCR
jgi:hypothetical protein